MIIGQNVKVEVDKQINIDCGPLIDATNITDFDITWYRNGLELSNSSGIQVVLSQDKRLCIISKTSLSTGTRPGNSGEYKCEVCTNLNTCRSNFTRIDICG